MELNSISLKIYNASNYIPIISVIPNAITLIAKAVFLCAQKTDNPGPFRAYVMEQSTCRCVFTILTLGVASYAFAIYDHMSTSKQTQPIKPFGLDIETLPVYSTDIETTGLEPTIEHEKMTDPIMRASDDKGNQFVAFRVSVDIPDDYRLRDGRRLIDVIGKNQQEVITLSHFKVHKEQAWWSCVYSGHQYMRDPFYFNVSDIRKPVASETADQEHVEHMKKFLKEGRVEHNGFVFRLV